MKNNKIQYIIFSLNNPVGLELCLQSFKHVEGQIESKDVTVIYQTDDGHKEGFESIKSAYDRLPFTESDGKDFKNILLEQVNKENVPICFMTDEDVFFDSFDTSIIYNCLEQDDVFCFSLNLGLNIKDCPQMNCKNVIIATQNDGYIKWDWTKHYLDFGFPLAVSGHIYGKEIIKLIKNINFTNHMELEESLQIFQNYPKNKMCAFDHSVAVGLRFDGGGEIKYDDIDFENVSTVCKTIKIGNNSSENIDFPEKDEDLIITVPPDEDLDDNGNYIGNDPEFLKDK